MSKEKFPIKIDATLDSDNKYHDIKVGGLVEDERVILNEEEKAIASKIIFIPIEDFDQLDELK